MAFTADRRLCLSADKSKVVEEGDASAAFLFALPGQEVTEADVEAYGLRFEGGKVVLPTAKATPKSAEKAMDKQEDKAAKKAEDKSVPRSEDKSRRRGVGREDSD